METTDTTATVRRALQQAIADTDQRLDYLLKEIIEMADGCRRVLATGQVLNYENSNVNGLGERYEELIRTISRQRAWRDTLLLKALQL